MLINRQLALDVLSAWEHVQNHPHSGLSKKTIPSEQDFYDMLDTLFQTSLLNEEGKPASTSITWVSRNDFENHEIGQMRNSKLTLEFESSIIFNARNLAKLSGIVNGKTSTLYNLSYRIRDMHLGYLLFHGEKWTNWRDTSEHNGDTTLQP